MLRLRIWAEGLQRYEIRIIGTERCLDLRSIMLLGNLACYITRNFVIYTGHVGLEVKTRSAYQLLVTTLSSIGWH
jgi:hypothetical protein